MANNFSLIPAEEFAVKNYDLSAKNPDGKSRLKYKSPNELMRDILEKENKITSTIRELKTLLRS